jgi:hypothetical protein
MKREKTGGRKMGVKNIQGNELREKIKIFLDGNFDLIQKDFEGLEPVQRVTFYERILKYAVPVLKNIEIEADVKETIPTREERDAYLKSVEDKLKEDLNL